MSVPLKKSTFTVGVSEVEVEVEVEVGVFFVSWVRVFDPYGLYGYSMLNHVLYHESRIPTIGGGGIP